MRVRKQSVGCGPSAQARSWTAPHTYCGSPVPPLQERPPPPTARHVTVTRTVHLGHLTSHCLIEENRPDAAVMTPEFFNTFLARPSP